MTAADAGASSVPAVGEPGIITVGLSAPYTPAAAGTGTDDYRCFLIPTGALDDRFITGVRFSPGNPAVVHHAILYRVDPSQVSAAEARDAKDPGEGWSCFGGPDLPAAADSDALGALQGAPWLAAWAPGGRESRYPEGTGVYIAKGSSVILQVHYNLLAGNGPDETKVELRTVPGTAGLTALQTYLLPAPVELPCPADQSGPLCDRQASINDTIQRFGGEALRTIWGLQFMCGGKLSEPKAGPTQSCTRPITKDMTVYAAAGHMHLLGRAITIVSNPGTDREKTLLSIDNWNFDNQGAIPLAKPVPLRSGDTIKVTCTHDAGLREKLPSFAGIPPRYVTWGEGTTDEMCLGKIGRAHV